MVELVAKHEDQERRFQAQLQGIDLPQTYFDKADLPQGLTPGQMQQHQISMQKARNLRDRMRQERRERY